MPEQPAPAAQPSTEARTHRPRRFIGVDVGLTGGVAALDSDGTLAVYPLPVLEARGKTSKGKRVLDPVGVIRLFDQLHAVALIDGTQVTAILEDVHAMPGQGVMRCQVWPNSTGPSWGTWNRG